MSALSRHPKPTPDTFNSDRPRLERILRCVVVASLWGIGTLVGIGGATGLAAGQEPEGEVQPGEVSNEASHAQTQEPGSLGGATVFVDPTTGELTDRATPRQRRALAAAARQLDLRRTQAGGAEPAERIRFFEVPGGVGAYLAGEFQSSLSVHLADDGSFHFGCSESHPTAIETDTDTEKELEGVIPAKPNVTRAPVQ